MCFVVLTFNGARLGGRELLEVLVERILLDARILVLILVPQDGLPVVMEPQQGVSWTAFFVVLLEIGLFLWIRAMVRL